MKLLELLQLRDINATSLPQFRNRIVLPSHREPFAVSKDEFGPAGARHERWNWGICACAGLPSPPFCGCRFSGHGTARPPQKRGEDALSETEARGKLWFLHVLWFLPICLTYSFKGYSLRPVCHFSLPTWNSNGPYNLGVGSSTTNISTEKAVGSLNKLLPELIEMLVAWVPCLIWIYLEDEVAWPHKTIHWVSGNAPGLFEETRAATFHPKLDDKLLGRFSIQDLAETRNLHFFLLSGCLFVFLWGCPYMVVNGDTWCNIDNMNRHPIYGDLVGRGTTYTGLAVHRLRGHCLILLQLFVRIKVYWPTNRTIHSFLAQLCPVKLQFQSLSVQGILPDDWGLYGTPPGQFRWGHSILTYWLMENEVAMMRIILSIVTILFSVISCYKMLKVSYKYNNDFWPFEEYRIQLCYAVLMYYRKI